MPKVSVIIPSYNYGHFLTQTVNSVLAQTYTDFEVIVVDDGSTDDTRQRMQPYVDKGKLTYIYQANKGLPGARNTGIRASAGAIIAFVDSDDIWTPDKLEKQIPKFENPNVGLVYGNTRKFYDAMVTRRTSFEGIAPARGRVTQELLRRTFVPMPTVCMRREVFDRIGLFDEPIQSPGEDIDMWLRMSLEYDFEYVDDVVAFYRVHATSVSANAAKTAARRLLVLDRFITKHRSRLEAEYGKTFLDQVLFELHSDVGKYQIAMQQPSRGRQELRTALRYQSTPTIRAYQLMSFIPALVPALYRWKIGRLRQQEFRPATEAEKNILGT